MAEILTIKSPRWNEFAETLSRTVLSVKHCRHDHRHAIAIMTAMGDVDIQASREYFASRGGFCDCEIMMNVACSEDDAA
jgi:hypothetical protein